MFCPQCGQPAPDGAEFCPACGSQLGTPRNDEPLDEIAGPPHLPAGAIGYAGFWRRVVAIFIDSIVLGIIAWPLGLIPAMAVMTDPDIASAIGKAAAAVVTRGLLTWVYFAAMESSGWQATLGKRAIGLKVTDTSGARISFRRASGRFFGKVLSCLLFGIGFLMAAFTARRQALHDLLVGTLVVR